MSAVRVAVSLWVQNDCRIVGSNAGGLVRRGETADAMKRLPTPLNDIAARLEDESDTHRRAKCGIGFAKVIVVCSREHDDYI